MHLSFFLKIHNNLSHLKEEEKARAWIYQIARNEIFDYIKKESKYVDNLESNIEIPSD